ncbi:MAG TPA: CHAT domain-containing protein [Flavilitoribacter sp.]|nr:CHAT domain-containing protein [Flavilitoribacter sp.]HMQ90623.1 CHAT domain-containing protein [Flavilitoribacter sp.]
MEILFLTFANSKEQPLETLTEEYSTLNKILSPRALRQHFLSWAISHATLDEIAYYLTLFRDRLSLFLYSGHAGRDMLITENGESRSGGIAHLLGQCARLKVVILNGCSTAGQVEALHHAGIPLVIATSAQIDDGLATRFSTRLFQSLEAGLNIGDSFEQAIGETLAVRDVLVTRGFDLQPSDQRDLPVWGVFPNPAASGPLTWKLPQQSVQAAHPNFEPNEILLDTLYETLALTNPAVRDLQQSGAELEEQRSDILFALLKALPAPISEQLRKLVAPSNPGAAHGWDKVGEMRLAQLAQTYQICMDFLVFTLIAQLWETAFQQGPGWKPKDGLRKELDTFFHLEAADRINYDYFVLIRTLREAFGKNSSSFFIEELRELKREFLEDEKVKNACFFLETVRRQVETAAFIEMGELCERAEIALSDLFGKLGFLGKYTLATVRNINVQKYHHTTEAQFEHLVMKWHGSQGIYDKEFRRQPELMDNRSVVLLRIGEEPARNRFLNLSPFILDENTFEYVPDLSLSKLYFFARREDERLFYKCVNAPETDVIDLNAPEFYERRKKTSKFQLAIDQFGAFYGMVVQPQTPATS